MSSLTAFGLEDEGNSIAIWHVDVVAGLLQTEAYARHIIGSYSRIEPVAPGMIGRLVRVRMRRQQAIDRADLELSVVFDESILQRRIGDGQGAHPRDGGIALAGALPELAGARLLPNVR
jgi:hypothetical protein